MSTTPEKIPEQQPLDQQICDQQDVRTELIYFLLSTLRSSLRRAITMNQATKLILARASDPIPSRLLSDFVWRDISDTKNAADKIVLYSQTLYVLMEEFEKDSRNMWTAIETRSVEERGIFLEETTEGLMGMVSWWDAELKESMDTVGLERIAESESGVSCKDRGVFGVDRELS
jgi:hypothetical protein